jgi:hypothetical protein
MHHHTAVEQIRQLHHRENINLQSVLHLTALTIVVKSRLWGVRHIHIHFPVSYKNCLLSCNDLQDGNYIKICT